MPTRVTASALGLELAPVIAVEGTALARQLLGGKNGGLGLAGLLRPFGHITQLDGAFGRRSVVGEWAARRCGARRGELSGTLRRRAVGGAALREQSPTAPPPPLPPPTPTKTAKQCRCAWATAPCGCRS